MLISRSLLVGLLAGVVAAVVVLEVTPLREFLATPVNAVQRFDHGQPALLKYSPFPMGIRVDGIQGRDLENIGMIVRVNVRAPNGKVIEGVEGLVDTGANRSFLQGALVEGLGVSPALEGIQVSEGISSLVSTMEFYDVIVEMPGGARINAPRGGDH